MLLFLHVVIALLFCLFVYGLCVCLCLLFLCMRFTLVCVVFLCLMFFDCLCCVLVVLCMMISCFLPLPETVLGCPHVCSLVSFCFEFANAFAHGMHVF